MCDMLISDSCVILDFCVINQLPLLRRLDLRIVIPEDLLVDELSDWEKSIRLFGFALDIKLRQTRHFNGGKGSKKASKMLALAHYES